MSDQKIGLSYSDDGGHTFKNLRQKDLGDTGDFQQPLKFNRLGYTRKARVYRVECSAPRRVSLFGAVMAATTQE